VPACALCGGYEVSGHYVYNGFRIVSCKRDGLIFVSPRPVDVTPYYDDRYFTGQFPGLYVDYGTHAREMVVEWKQRLDRIAELCGGPSTLVDIGSATGDFMEVAQDCGWKTFGIEQSEWAAKKALDEKGLDVFNGGITDAKLATGSFMAVTMWDCIEHLKEPAVAIGEASRILADGGILAISTGSVPHRDPYLTSGWYYPPWHLYYFSVNTLTAMCEAHDFEVAHCTFTGSGTPSELVTLFATRNTRNRQRFGS
jgi:SAM-dependent methyltransferase